MSHINKYFQLLLIVFSSYILNGQIHNSSQSNHLLKSDESVPVDPFGPPLYFVPDMDTVYSQDSIVFDIYLGDEETPAENVHGISMKLIHNVEEVFGSDNSATFDSCWLGVNNVDMLTLGMPMQDGIDIAMARIDNQNRTGYGYLTNVKVIIPDNLGEIIKDFQFEFKDVNIVSYQEDTIRPNIIYGDPVVILNKEELDVNLLEKGLKVYPNPNSGVFNIDSRLKLDKIRIMDLSGRLMHELFTPSQHEVLNLSGFEKGVYLIELQSGNLTAYERIFIE